MVKATVSFYTFGCRLNQSETAVLERTFLKARYRIVKFGLPADIIVVNTCTVTEHGDTDTRRIVNRIVRTNPQARIALIGCQAQIQKEQLSCLPNVRWIIGNARKTEVVSILKKHPRAINSSAIVITPAIPRKSFTVPVAGIDEHHTRANLKIQDGCDFFCSFCEIPYARGRARSREFRDILKEAKVLIAAGHQELVLTGINLGTYHFEQKKIMDVLAALESLDGLKRLRVSSLEPTTIPMELFEKMSSGKIICRSLHIPLQSGSDAILQKMERRYGVREFSDLIKNIHSKVPGICIGTDVIVGFPGETDQDFQSTLELVKRLPLAYVHVFSYSQRHHNKARRIPDPVAIPTIQRRSVLLRALSLRKRQDFFSQQIGQTATVLFEEQKNGSWLGLTDNYIRVKIQSSQPLKNCFKKVLLGKIEGEQILGKVFP